MASGNVTSGPSFSPLPEANQTLMFLSFRYLKPRLQRADSSKWREHGQRPFFQEEKKGLIIPKSEIEVQHENIHRGGMLSGSPSSRAPEFWQQEASRGPNRGGTKPTKPWALAQGTPTQSMIPGDYSQIPCDPAEKERMECASTWDCKDPRKESTHSAQSSPNPGKSMPRMASFLN